VGLIDLQRQIVALCFDETPSDATLASLGQREAWLTYRDMIRERLLRELRLALPRTRALVGDAAFDAAFAHHLQHKPPRVRYFREVVAVFVASALPLWAAQPALHPATSDLVRYELALWEARDLPAAPEDVALRELDFEHVTVVSRALRLLELSYAVRPGEGLQAQKQRLCVQRAPDTDRIKVWRLTPSTHRLLSRLQREDKILSEVVKELAGGRIDAAYLDGLCTTLAQFVDVGIILGSR
jgi:hypothetical protein